MGKKHLTWKEIIKEITRQNATQIGNISKGIQTYIWKVKQEKINKFNKKYMSMAVSSAVLVIVAVLLILPRYTQQRSAFTYLI